MQHDYNQVNHIKLSNVKVEDVWTKTDVVAKRVSL